MNKSTIEAGQPEQKPNSEQQPIESTSAPAIGNTNVIGRASNRKSSKQIVNKQIFFMKLYKIENGLGIYWVIASHPTEAEKKLKDMLNKHDYGFYEKRKAITITVVAEAIENNFLSGKSLVL